LLCRLVGVDERTTLRDAAIEGSSLPTTRSAVPLVAAHRRLADQPTIAAPLPT